METIEKNFIRLLRLPINRFTAFRQLRKFHSQPRTIEEIVDWSIKFPSKGYFRVDSIQKRSEILSLAKMVSELNPQNILEIGTARGGTLFLWSQIVSKKVISCDLNTPGYKHDFYKSLPPTSSSCSVINIKGDTHEPECKKLIEDELNGEKVDFLFIDGDHTEKGVEEDYHNYVHLVRPGGLIAFHDILEKQPVPTNQVYYFWNRIKDNNKTVEFVDNPNQEGFGIGVIKVSE